MLSWTPSWQCCLLVHDTVCVTVCEVLAKAEMYVNFEQYPLLSTTCAYELGRWQKDERKGGGGIGVYIIP